MPPKFNEDWAQAQIRLEGAAISSIYLTRNNVGVLVDRYGRPVRYGLANSSAAENARIKSADLIGWRTVTITPDMVGRRIAQFLSREAKAPGWHYTGTDREVAQKAWADLVNAAGGDACFATGIGTL